MVGLLHRTFSPVQLTMHDKLNIHKVAMKKVGQIAELNLTYGTITS